MPYKSDAQRRYMHWAKSQGKISPKVVKEFDEASKGRKLPERVEKDSQMGADAGGPSPTGASFGNGAPAAAVQHLTPQVQATRPPNQPGQVSRMMTAAPSMPKMAMISFSSFADELQKIVEEA